MVGGNDNNDDDDDDDGGGGDGGSDNDVKGVHSSSFQKQIKVSTQPKGIAVGPDGTVFVACIGEVSSSSSSSLKAFASFMIEFLMILFLLLLFADCCYQRWSHHLNSEGAL